MEETPVRAASRMLSLSRNGLLSNCNKSWDIEPPSTQVHLEEERRGDEK